MDTIYENLGTQRLSCLGLKGLLRRLIAFGHLHTVSIKLSFSGLFYRDQSTASPVYETAIEIVIIVAEHWNYNQEEYDSLTKVNLCGQRCSKPDYSGTSI